MSYTLQIDDDGHADLASNHGWYLLCNWLMSQPLESLPHKGLCVKALCNTGFVEGMDQLRAELDKLPTPKNKDIAHTLSDFRKSIASAQRYIVVSNGM